MFLRRYQLPGGVTKIIFCLLSLFLVLNSYYFIQIQPYCPFRQANDLCIHSGVVVFWGFLMKENSTETFDQDNTSPYKIMTKWFYSEFPLQVKFIIMD